MLPFRISIDQISRQRCSKSSVLALAFSLRIDRLSFAVTLNTKCFIIFVLFSLTANLYWEWQSMFWMVFVWMALKFLLPNCCVLFSELCWVQRHHTALVSLSVCETAPQWQLPSYLLLTSHKCLLPIILRIYLPHMRTHGEQRTRWLSVSVAAVFPVTSVRCFEKQCRISDGFIAVILSAPAFASWSVTRRKRFQHL